MKQFFLWFCLLGFILSGHAANSVTDKVYGRVLEKNTNIPISYANVSVYQSVTDKFVTGTVTDDSGKFSFKSLSRGDYYFQYSYIGYEKVQSLPIKVDNEKTVVNLGSIYLTSSAQILNEVVVKGRKSTYVQNIDKRVFNVGQDLMSASGSASDLMQNIPSVQVDVEGNVSLRGNENVEILINGKPSTMMSARTRADVLQQLPANDIERVEVITNPSAQYKPDGVSGIINIVMKKQRTVGVNGNIIANVGSGGRTNASTSVNYNTGRVNLFANYGIRYDYRNRTTMDDRIRNDGSLSYISQLTDSKARPLSHIIRAGMDWNINSDNSLQISGGYNHRSFIRTENIATNITDDSQNITYQAIRYRHDDENTKQAEASAVFSHTFGDNHQLTVDYNYSLQEGMEDNKYSTFSTDDFGTKDNTQIGQAYYQHLFRVSYDRPLNSSLKLNLGYEADLLKTDLNFHVQNLEGDIFVPDLQKTSDFTNYQYNHAMYATLEYQHDRLGVLFGIRPEYMKIESRLFTLDSIAKNNYFMIYPTLHTSYKLNERNEIQLNYSLRVNRPDGEDMNPFPEYQNPLSLKAGNPYLKPEKIHSIEAGYQWKTTSTTILGALYYRYVTNKLTTVTKYIDNSILLTTKENLNSSSSAGMELILNTGFGKWATFNLSGNGFYNQINAEKLGYGKNKSDFSWSAALNANFNIWKGIMLQLNSRYISSSLLPQGKREGTFIANLGAKYDLPRTNVSFMATLSDVFNTFKKVYTIDTPELKQRIEQRRDPRIFYIGATWNFGATSKKAKHDLKYDEAL